MTTEYYLKGGVTHGSDYKKEISCVLMFCCTWEEGDKSAIHHTASPSCDPFSVMHQGMI